MVVEVGRMSAQSARKKGSVLGMVPVREVEPGSHEDNPCIHLTY